MSRRFGFTIPATGQALASAAVALGLIVLTAAHPAAAASSPSVSMSPGVPFANAEKITVSVGPNSIFAPHTRVNILECADPGGTAANLPKDDSTCDGNTIQADSVLVNADGSFSSSGYSLYQLPSSALGEQPNSQPACNATQVCVLFVGENQNDFTQAHLFSAPFTISASSPSASTSTSTTAGAAASSSGSSSASDAATVTAPASGKASSLAFTGSSVALLWLAAGGLLLIVIGLAGRRRSVQVES